MVWWLRSRWRLLKLLRKAEAMSRAATRDIASYERSFGGTLMFDRTRKAILRFENERLGK